MIQKFLPTLIEKTSDEENSDKENFDEETSDEENSDKKFLMKKKNLFFLYIKMKNNYYKKDKEKFQKEAHEKY